MPVTATISDDWNCEKDSVDAPSTDAYGNRVSAFDDVEPKGAGAVGSCDSCGASRHFIALYAATDNTSKENWCEYYVCECGATGEYRYESATASETWHGQIS